MSENFFNDCLNGVIFAISCLIILNLFALTLEKLISPKNTNSKTDMLEIPKLNALQIIAATILFAIVVIPIWSKDILSAIPAYVLTYIIFGLYVSIGFRFFKLLLFTKDAAPLDESEQSALFIFVFLFILLMQRFDFSQVFAVASAPVEQAAKDILLLFGLYLFSSIAIFSLLVHPASFFATVILKISPRISSAFRIAKRCFARKLEIPNEFSPLYKQCLPRYKRSFISVVSLPISIALDILCYMLLYAFQIFIVLPLAIIVYIMSICGSILLFMSQKIAKFSPRRALFFSFRCSIVLASTLVVITIRVLSRGHPDTVSCIVEFIASVIVIPVVFHWIQNILEEWRNSKVSNGTNDTSPPTT